MSVIHDAQLYRSMPVFTNKTLPDALRQIEPLLRHNLQRQSAIRRTVL